jgi:hypothetical protein
MNTAIALQPLKKAGTQKEEHLMNWEYSVVQLNIPMFSEAEILNSLGDNGWELVNILMIEPDRSTAYFKRPKR